MRWLIEVVRTTDLQELAEALRVAHGSLRDVDPVPMGPDELVLFVEGPSDLPRRLATAQIPGIHVYPDSEPQAY
jgi:hypothetical protein